MPLPSNLAPTRPPTSLQSQVTIHALPDSVLCSILEQLSLQRHRWACYPLLCLAVSLQLCMPTCSYAALRLAAVPLLHSFAVVGR